MYFPAKGVNFKQLLSYDKARTLLIIFRKTNCYNSQNVEGKENGEVPAEGENQQQDGDQQPKKRYNNNRNRNRNRKPRTQQQNVGFISIQ